MERRGARGGGGLPRNNRSVLRYKITIEKEKGKEGREDAVRANILYTVDRRYEPLEVHAIRSREVKIYGVSNLPFSTFTSIFCIGTPASREKKKRIKTSKLLTFSAPNVPP